MQTITKKEADELLEKQFYNETIDKWVYDTEEYEKKQTFIQFWYREILLNRTKEVKEKNSENILKIFDITKNDIILEKIKIRDEVFENLCFVNFSNVLKIENTDDYICFKKDKYKFENIPSRKTVEKLIRAEKIKTYIMVDLSNKNTYKIGKSISPEYRERTLQSEKPTIELKYIAEENVENIIHKEYKNNRIRGEWFKLTEDELINIVIDYKFKSVN
jgi:hypothetical protein